MPIRYKCYLHSVWSFSCSKFTHFSGFGRFGSLYRVLQEGHQLWEQQGSDCWRQLSGQSSGLVPPQVPLCNCRLHRVLSSAHRPDQLQGVHGRGRTVHHPLLRTEVLQRLSAGCGDYCQFGVAGHWVRGNAAPGERLPDMRIHHQRTRSSRYQTLYLTILQLNVIIWMLDASVSVGSDGQCARHRAVQQRAHGRAEHHGHLRHHDRQQRQLLAVRGPASSLPPGQRTDLFAFVIRSYLTFSWTVLLFSQARMPAGRTLWSTCLRCRTTAAMPLDPGPTRPATSSATTRPRTPRSDEWFTRGLLFHIVRMLNDWFHSCRISRSQAGNGLT